MTLFSVALKNLRRNPARTALLLVIVGCAASMVFASLLLKLGIENALRTGTARLGADILVVPEQAESDATAALISGKPTHFLMDRDVLERVRAVAGVDHATPQLFIKPRAMTCCYNVDVFLIAFDPATDLTIRPWLVNHLRTPLGPAEIITGSSVPVLPGDMIPFFGTNFTVAGTMDPTGMDVLDRSVFMSLETAYRMAEDSRERSPQPIMVDRDRISAVLAAVREGGSPDRVAIGIEHAVPGIRAITTSSVTTLVKDQISGTVRVVISAGVLLWAVVLLITAFAFMMIVQERRRELGLLRAMGATRGHLCRLVLTEAAGLSAAGALCGIGLSTFLLLLFEAALMGSLKVPYLFPPAMTYAAYAAATMVFSVASGVLAAAMPAVSIAKREPYEVIRGSE